MKAFTEKKKWQINNDSQDKIQQQLIKIEKMFYILMYKTKGKVRNI